MDAGIFFQGVIKKSVTDVDGPDVARSILQETIREASCGGAHIETHAALGGKLEIIQRSAQFLTGA